MVLATFILGKVRKAYGSKEQISFLGFTGIVMYWNAKCTGTSRSTCRSAFALFAHRNLPSQPSTIGAVVKFVHGTGGRHEQAETVAMTVVAPRN
ncbi:hypothetical protein ABBQ38_013710 [Trebouxia sp. C0009 RCD-2024]